MMSSGDDSRNCDREKDLNTASSFIHKPEGACFDMVESTSDSLYLVDEDCRYLFINSQHLTRLGIPSADIIGRPYSDFHSPEDTQMFTERVSRVFSTGESIRQEHHSGRDGRHFLRTFSPVKDKSPEGRTKRVAVISKDITELKQLEEDLKRSELQYRTTIDSMRDAIHVVDRDLRIILANSAFEEWTGKLSIKTDIVGLTVFEAFPFLKETVREEYEEVFRTKNALVTEENTILSGEEIHTEVRKIPVMQGEKVVQIITVVGDITGRKRLEAQLRHAQKMEAIGTLAGGIAHDFNNLLSGIIGHAALMKMDPGVAETHLKRLESIEELVQSASGLTSQLLGFARMGRYETVTLDVNEFLEKTAAMFSRTRKEIMIHKRLSKDMVPVDADRSQLEQVFMNLFVNAWQAMPGGGDLHIETSSATITDNGRRPAYMKPGVYARISVTDNGEGMDEAAKDRIFEPFFTTKEMGRGTGLGLAMVYGIVKGHNGYINVYSEKGQGTTFNIYLPASERQVIKTEETPVKGSFRGNETILIIDDEQHIIDVMRDILESLGYTVLMARNGDEAIELYKREKGTIDLVILDMIMPGMSGGETFDGLKELNPAVNVVLSSGYSIDGMARKIMRKGCKAFIQKPLTVTDLSKKIREVLDKTK